MQKYITERKTFLIGTKVLVNGFRLNGKSFMRKLFVVDVQGTQIDENEIIFLSNLKTKEITHALKDRVLIYLTDDEKPILANECDWVINCAAE